ncbi:MAG: hypothetical protein DHS20C12_10500 [Pseudohongiella sp.]|nr:MAG: hypothetical protein DHS20C12_10500 [Pseudohongiella sp.]
MLRLNNPVTDSGVNRENERLALEAAHLAAIAPVTSFHSSDLLVTPFLEGEQATLGDLAEIGELFSRVHSFDVELSSLDLLQHLESYYEDASPDPLLTACYRRVVDLFPEGEVELKPCHIDCLLPNIIRAKQGLQLIDWEYAAKADPAYDIAVFSGTYGLDEGQKELLLAGYGLVGDGFRERLGYFEVCYGLIEVLWWRLRGRDMRKELGALMARLGL